MGISDRIETFIMELLKDDAGWVDLGRNELAEIFHCAPSQINYVITTRFGPERGYIVESRRGGGGYLKIRRIKPGTLQDAANSIGDSVSYKNLQALLHSMQHAGNLDAGAVKMIGAGLADKNIPLPAAERDHLRAGILKAMLLAGTEQEGL